MQSGGVVRGLLERSAGAEIAERTISTLEIDGLLLAETGPNVSRAAFAMALNALLFSDLIRRVPNGAAYVRNTVRAGGRVVFDHGAVRTIRFSDTPTGALPAGQDAITRILQPLGYELADTYPLPKLRMTGRAYCHVDFPETLPQFFLSELHVGRFSPEFGTVAQRVFARSRDPLNDHAKSVLTQFAGEGRVSLDEATVALPAIAGAFGCHHATVALADYEALLAESAEAAWIATEGNAFNHATDRVPDVIALAERLRDEGFPIKDRVEISTSGHVRQTAFRADMVRRDFVSADGAIIERSVPGSFYEFISRDRDPNGALDLRFDSGNATGIFAMTSAA